MLCNKCLNLCVFSLLCFLFRLYVFQVHGQEVFKFVFLFIFKVAAYVFFAEFFYDYTKKGLSLKYSCM